MLDLVRLPNDLLHQKSQPLTDVNGQTADLAQRMIATMQAARGVGLAAVQIGRLERIFVLQIPDQDPMVFINPEILEYSPDTRKSEEGCLSIPGIYADVIRPAAVHLRALNLEGHEFTLEADDYLARVIQHEYDHLEGTLFYEHLRPGTRSRLLKLYDKNRRA